MTTPPDPSRDPRLELPEALTKPIPPSRFDPLKGQVAPGERPAGKGDGGVNMAGMSRAYGLAIEFVVYIVVCAGIGWAVDRFVVGGGQTWTVVGAGFGLFGAGYRAFKVSQQMSDSK